MTDTLRELLDTVGSIKSLQEAIEIALSLERKTEAFYAQRARETSQELYTYLREEETRHIQYLEDYRKERKIPPKETKKFIWNISREFGDKPGEIGILLAALRLERKSEYLYQALGQQTENPEEKEFYNTMAQFERTHYDLIDGLLEYATNYRVES